VRLFSQAQYTDALLLSTLLAAQAFHLVPDKKLRALPLEVSK
jgi:hypothetical protein